MSHLKIAKPVTEAQKITQTTLDCWSITVADIKSWKLPLFQRPLKVNDKVQQLAGQIVMDDGVIPGVFCIGFLDGERYLVDGQHRCKAFTIAAEMIKEGPPMTGYVDVRVVHFGSMAEMAIEFKNLNSRLVNMRADDILRAMEMSCPSVSAIRRSCPFVGYDNIRRGDRSPLISMSTALRVWTGSAHDVPHTTGTSAADLAAELSDEESALSVNFLRCCFEAWGRDVAYQRLYSTMNLMLCAWLYRRIVLSAYSAKTKQIDDSQFVRCLMHLSADKTYVDWLVGRNGKRDIGPAYMRIKAIFASRLEADTGSKHYLPQPPWASK
jgi:hypothetical protein